MATIDPTPEQLYTQQFTRQFVPELIQYPNEEPAMIYPAPDTPGQNAQDYQNYQNTVSVAAAQLYPQQYFNGQFYVSTAANTVSALGWTGINAYQSDPAALEQARKALEEQQRAIERSLKLLEKKIGAEAVAKIVNGGAYPIPSKLWDGVVYLVPAVPSNRIDILDHGTKVADVCIVVTDYTLPWPDIMLRRIIAIQMDESVLYATGVYHKVPATPIKDMAKKLVGCLKFNVSLTS